MKKIFASFTLVVAFVVAVLFGIFWWSDSIKPVSDDPEQVRFLINKGASAQSIGNNLEEKGLIRSALAFKLYLQLTDKSKSINSGEFRLSRDMNLTEVVDALGRNPTEIWVTIPEGFRREQIAQRIASDLEIADPQLFTDEFMTDTQNLEGQLFPDTYLFSKELTVEKIVDSLNSNFKKKYQQALDDSGTSKSVSEILTMASLIERETITKGERPIVAGILWKRLDNGWPLQVDATVQYVWGTKRCEGKIEDCDWWVTPTRADLEIDSPYNTYKITSLPPTPIANPGYDSILAALKPEESDYWYYIHDTNGKIHYASTLDEHNSNVSRYLN